VAVGRVKLPFAGTDQYADPAALAEGKWQRLRNLAPRKSGIVGRRPALQYVSTVVPNWWHWDARARTGSLGVASAIEGYWRWAQYLRPVKFLFDANFSGLTMIAITVADVPVQDATAPTAVERTAPAGTMLLLTAPGLVVGNGVDPVIRCGVLGQATRDPSLFSFNGITYAFAGQNSGRYVDASPDSLLPIAWDYFEANFGATAGPFEPDGAAVVRDRVVYYKGPNVYWSDKNDPLSLGSDILTSRGINVGGEELENITAVSELSTSADGSPVQSVAAVWTKSRCFLLLGEPLESDALPGENVIGSLQINRLNIEAGCVSQASVCRTPYGTFWVGIDDVWFMPYGQLPLRVGTAIRPAIEAQPVGLRWRIHSEYSEGILRVSMFAPGQGPLIHDPCKHQWWLDLRQGPPSDAGSARWFGPQEFAQFDTPDWSDKVSNGSPGVWCMARDQRETGDGRLYALQSFKLQDSVNAVYGMSLCGFDAPGDLDVTAPQAPRSIWQAGYAYNQGDEIFVTPEVGNFDSPSYVCTTAGTSGGSEPTWAPNASGQVTDGTVTWTARYFDGTNALSSRIPNLALASAVYDWSMLGPEIFGGDEMVEKLLDGAEIGCALPASTQLTYNMHPNQQQRSRIITPTFDVAAGDVNEAGNWTGARVWQARQLTPDPNKRFNALTATWECKQDPGIVIVAGVNDTITGSTSGGIGSWSATIAAGYYANLEAFATAVRTAIQTASGSIVDTTIDVDLGYSRALFGIRDATYTISVDTGSKLAQLLGYDPLQGAQSVADGDTEFAYSWDSPLIQHAPDMQISGVNLRLKAFGRRPT